MASTTDSKSVSPPGPDVGFLLISLSFSPSFKAPQSKKIEEEGGFIPFLRSLVQTHGSTFSFFTDPSTHYYCTLDPKIIKKVRKNTFFFNLC